MPVTPSVGANATLRTPSGAVGSSVTTTTAADGTAQVQVMLGPSVGSVTITASRDDAPGVSAGFVATGGAYHAHPHPSGPRQRFRQWRQWRARHQHRGGSAGDARWRSGQRHLPSTGRCKERGASPAESTTGADGIARIFDRVDANANGQIGFVETRAGRGGNAVTYVVNAVPGAPVDSLQAISGAANGRTRRGPG